MQYERLATLAANYDKADGIMGGAVGEGGKVDAPSSSKSLVAALEAVTVIPETCVWFMSEVWRWRL